MLNTEIKKVAPVWFNEPGDTEKWVRANGCDPDNVETIEEETVVSPLRAKLESLAEVKED